jgi:hypothetical protein
MPGVSRVEAAALGGCPTAPGFPLSLQRDRHAAFFVVTIPTGWQRHFGAHRAVFNATSEFLVDPKNPNSKAFFLFVTEDGTIAGWNQP